MFPYPNPYQQVLDIMCTALAPFDDDNLIPAYGFGDDRTTDKTVFSFCSNGAAESPCVKLEGVLTAYNSIIQQIHAETIKMSGPTTFAPLIYKAIEIVKQEMQYHILLIICDGGVSESQKDIDAIVEASEYPLSIICVGVGQGPWDDMEHFDDSITHRKFDNFQFVNYHEKIVTKCENPHVEFARQALMEIPVQYRYIKKYLL